jgi:hypothetical protein
MYQRKFYSFISTILDEFYFILFWGLALLQWLRYPTQCWLSGKSKYTCLVPDLTGTAFSRVHGTSKLPESYTAL